MRIWVDGQSCPPNDFKTLHQWSLTRSWLLPAVDFLQFWFSDDTGWQAQTSGSTSAPKKIQISRNRLVASARISNAFFHFRPETDGLASCISAQYVGGFMVLARALLSGCDAWLVEPTSSPRLGRWPFMPNLVWFVSVVPLQLEALARTPEICDQSVAWKGILVGGASVSFSQLQRIMHLQCPVYQSYGMTETVSHIAVRVLHPGLELNENPYQVLPGVAIRTNTGQTLEICAEVTENKWITTNDRVQMVTESTFHYLGRTDDIVNSGALKIDPQVVKKAMLKVVPPHCISFELVALPDDRLGQKLVLAYTTTGTGQPIPNWSKIMEELSLLVEKKWMPKAIYFVPAMPLLPNLKPDKITLANQLENSAPVWPARQTDINPENQ